MGSRVPLCPNCEEAPLREWYESGEIYGYVCSNFNFDLHGPQDRGCGKFISESDYREIFAEFKKQVLAIQASQHQRTTTALSPTSPSIITTDAQKKSDPRFAHFPPHLLALPLSEKLNLLQDKALYERAAVRVIIKTPAQLAVEELQVRKREKARLQQQQTRFTQTSGHPTPSPLQSVANEKIAMGPLGIRVDPAAAQRIVEQRQAAILLRQQQEQERKDALYKQQLAHKKRSEAAIASLANEQKAKAINFLPDGTSEEERKREIAELKRKGKYRPPKPKKNKMLKEVKESKPKRKKADGSEEEFDEGDSDDDSPDDWDSDQSTDSDNDNDNDNDENHSGNEYTPRASRSRRRYAPTEQDILDDMADEFNSALGGDEAIRQANMRALEDGTADIRTVRDIISNEPEWKRMGYSNDQYEVHRPVFIVPNVIDQNLNELVKKDESKRYATLGVNWAAIPSLVPGAKPFVAPRKLEKKVEEKSIVEEATAEYLQGRLEKALKNLKRPDDYEDIVCWRPSPEDVKRLKKANPPLDLCSIIVPWNIGFKLRPHQREGVRFLTECVLGQRGYNGEGCILADDMGLGKTLQSVALIYTLLTQGFCPGLPVCKKVVVTCPTSLVQNWSNEFTKWLGRDVVLVQAITMSGKELIGKAIKAFVTGPYQVLVLSYEQLRTNVDKLLPTEQCPNGSCDLLICDEAHRLKNYDTSTYKALNELKCKKRVLLTGTPVQNELKEFYSMLNFANPGSFGTIEQFCKKYQNPIIRGREPGADLKEKQLGDQRAHELSRTVCKLLIRRTNTLLSKHLPPKVIEVVCTRLSPLQERLYREFSNQKEILDFLSQEGDEFASLMAAMSMKDTPDDDNDDDQGPKKRGAKKGDGKTPMILPMINQLKQLSNHPKLLYDSLLNKDKDKMTELDEKLIKLFPPSFSHNGAHPKYSGKLAALDRLVCSVRNQTDDRFVIVSNYTQTLDLIEQLCAFRQWKFLRVDGSTSTKKRQGEVDKLCAKKNDYVMFLLSSKAGGCGLNIVGANRLVLFDPDWNPAVDKQAAGRIWRDGQLKRCFVYRFLSTGSIDEKIYQRQISKDGLTEVMGGNNLDANVSQEDLRKLFVYNDTSSSDTHDTLECSCHKTNGQQTDYQLGILTEEDNNNPVDIDYNAKYAEKISPNGEQRPNLLQRGWAKENDLECWSHHTSILTVPDPLFRESCVDQFRGKTDPSALIAKPNPYVQESNAPNSDGVGNDMVTMVLALEVTGKPLNDDPKGLKWRPYTALTWRYGQPLGMGEQRKLEQIRKQQEEMDSLVDYKSFVDSDDDPNDAIVHEPRSRLPMDLLTYELEEERKAWLDRITFKTALIEKDYLAYLRNGTIPGREKDHESAIMLAINGGKKKRKKGNKSNNDDNQDSFNSDSDEDYDKSRKKKTMKRRKTNEDHENDSKSNKKRHQKSQANTRMVDDDDNDDEYDDNYAGDADARGNLADFVGDSDEEQEMDGSESFSQSSSSSSSSSSSDREEDQQKEEPIMKKGPTKTKKDKKVANSGQKTQARHKKMIESESDNDDNIVVINQPITCPPQTKQPPQKQLLVDETDAGLFSEDRGYELGSGDDDHNDKKIQNSQNNKILEKPSKNSSRTTKTNPTRKASATSKKEQTQTTFDSKYDDNSNTRTQSETIITKKTLKLPTRSDQAMIDSDSNAEQIQSTTRQSPTQTNDNDELSSKKSNSNRTPVKKGKKSQLIESGDDNNGDNSLDDGDKDDNTRRSQKSPVKHDSPARSTRSSTFKQTNDEDKQLQQKSTPKKNTVQITPSPRRSTRNNPTTIQQDLPPIALPPANPPPIPKTLPPPIPKILPPPIPKSTVLALTPSQARAKSKADGAPINLPNISTEVQFASTKNAINKTPPALPSTTSHNNNSIDFEDDHEEDTEYDDVEDKTQSKQSSPDSQKSYAYTNTLPPAISTIQMTKSTLLNKHQSPQVTPLEDLLLDDESDNEITAKNILKPLQQHSRHNPPAQSRFTSGGRK